MKKSTKIIIAVVSVILVAAIVFAVLYFATDLFKTKNPKKAFFEQLDKVAASENEFSYSDMIANLKKTQDSSYEGKGKMSMDIELGGMLAREEYANIIEVLNDAEISYESKVDAKNSNSYTSMNITYNGKDLGKIDLLVSDEKIGAKIDGITDKYLTVTVDELMEALDLDTSSIDMSNLSENIDINEVVDILDISNDEIKRITDRYKKVLEDAIPEDNYSSKDEKITVNGKEINAKAYTVEISEKDLVKIAKNILKSLEEDDATLNLLIDKVNKLMELSGESSMKLTKSNVKSIIEAGLEEIEGASGFLDEKIQIVMYVNKDEIVRFQFSMGDDAIIIDSLKDKDTTNMELKLKVEGEEMTIMKIESTKKGDNNYSTKLSTDIQGFKMEVTLDMESSDKGVKEDMKMYIEVPNMIKATLNLSSDVEYKSVTIDKLSSSNSIVATRLTTSEQTKLMYGLLEYLDKHIDVIKEIATKMGYEDEIEEFEKQLNALKTQQTQATTTPNSESDEQ